MAAVEPQERPAGPADSELPVDDASPPPAVRPAARAGWWYLALVAALAGLVFAAVGAVNYRLNPLVYDDDTIREVAGYLDAGQNYANYDPNINWRALRREQIRQWTSTPDVIVFGGSRWWEAHHELVPGRSFANLWVSNDQAEDALALAYLLERADRLPKTLVLSLRFISFQPPAERDAAEWQEWAPEYSAMARQLGLTPHNLATNTPVKAMSAMFYAPGAWDRAVQVSKVDARPHATSELQQPKLETIAADGSIYWSKATRAKFTKAYVDKGVKAELRRIGTTAPDIDTGLVDDLEAVVRHLTSKGVRVVLAQTPYHPAFWAAVQSRPFGATLHRLEGIAQRMADRDGVLAVGGYDPAPYGCAAADFIDQIHANTACVGKVLHLIPDLATGA
jgi:hypothetical protein